MQQFKNSKLSPCKLIRHNIDLSDTFNFDSVSLDDILREVTRFNIAKNGILKNISTLCLKEVSDICNPEVFGYFQGVKREANSMTGVKM